MLKKGLKYWESRKQTIKKKIQEQCKVQRKHGMAGKRLEWGAKEVDAKEQDKIGDGILWWKTEYSAEKKKNRDARNSRKLTEKKNKLFYGRTKEENWVKEIKYLRLRPAVANETGKS